MTGYTVHTGSSDKFSKGWDQIFGSPKGKRKKSAASKPAQQPATGKKSASSKDNRTSSEDK